MHAADSPRQTVSESAIRINLLCARQFRCLRL